MLVFEFLGFVRWAASSALQLVTLSIRPQAWSPLLHGVIFVFSLTYVVTKQVLQGVYSSCILILD